MVDLEALDPFSLPSILLKNRQKLPPIACVYFAIDFGCIQYIGQSKNLKTRWLGHHRFYSLSPESSIAWYENEDSSLLPQIERGLIRRFSPPLNEKGISMKRTKEANPSPVIEVRSVDDLPNKVWRARRICGQNLGRVCHEVGVTRKYWNQIENGLRASIPLHTLRSMEQVLGIDFGIEG